MEGALNSRLTNFSGSLIESFSLFKETEVLLLI